MVCLHRRPMFSCSASRWTGDDGRTLVTMSGVARSEPPTSRSPQLVSRLSRRSVTTKVCNRPMARGSMHWREHARSLRGRCEFDGKTRRCARKISLNANSSACPSPRGFAPSAYTTSPLPHTTLRRIRPTLIYGNQRKWRKLTFRDAVTYEHRVCLLN